MNILVAYSTRYGATKSTAEEIGAALARKGHAVEVMDARRATKARVAEADAVVVGSSIAAGMWKGPAKRAMARASRAGTPYAVFVSAGGVMTGMARDAKEGDAPTVPMGDRIARAVSLYVDDRVARLPTAPVARTAFGGRMEMAGQVRFDNRDPEASRAWADELDRLFASASRR